MRTRIWSLAYLCSTDAGTSDGRSIIKMSDLFFKRPKESAENYTQGDGFTGLVEVVVFERSQQDLIGYASEVALPPLL